MGEVKRRTRARPTPPRYQQLLDGVITIEDLDDEEIMRGQMRNVHGDFRGRPPLMVPREFATILVKRQQDVFLREIAGMVLTALRTMDDIMNGRFKSFVPGDTSAAMQAAKLVLERYAGKVPDKLEMRAEIATWEKKAQEAIVVMDLDEEDEQKEIEQ